MFFWGEKNLTLFCGHYCIFFNKSCSHVFNDIVVCKRKMQAQLDLAAFYRVFCLSRNPETRSLARATHQLEALNHWHKKSERKKKVVNDPLPFPFFFLFLRLPTSTNVTLNHAKLDNNTVSVSLKKSRNLRCCVRYFFKLSFTPILAPKKLFFPFLFNGWMVKKMQKEPKDTSTVYLSLPLKVMHRTF